MKQAKEAYAAGDINSAVSYYEKALSIDSDNTDVRFALADIYMSKKDYDAALVLYQEIINTDPKSKEAYKKLISIYESKKDYDAIVALRDSAKDESILKLFADYTVSEPKLSKSSGKYGEAIELTITADSGTKIYYSYDSDNPLTRGERYYNPITLDKEGTYEITAVAVDDRGIKSEVASARYEIEFEAPKAPEVDPVVRLVLRPILQSQHRKTARCTIRGIRRIQVLHQQNIQHQYLFLRETMCFLLLR